MSEQARMISLYLHEMDEVNRLLRQIKDHCDNYMNLNYEKISVKDHGIANYIKCQLQDIQSILEINKKSLLRKTELTHDILDKFEEKINPCLFTNNILRGIEHYAYIAKINADDFNEAWEWFKKHIYINFQICIND